MKLQQVLSYTRRAIDDYHMIEEGDKIAIGISGGKDSLTLLYALHGLKRFYPKKFELSAITVDLGYEKRQVVSGIAKFYKPEELVGKKVIIVANLKPAKLCGVDSYGMLLASGEEDVKVVFLDKSAKNGDRVH